MKVNHSIVLMSLIFIILLIILFILVKQEPEEPVIVSVPVPVPVRARAREPEFRNPPLREYKPASYQQVGLLMGEGSDMYPIYGRPSYTYNNRWNYYTTTKGEQIYPLPISNGDRDCTEDIGCDELYGNENLSIFGKDGTYKSKIYRVTTM